jgi:putative transposase
MWSHASFRDRLYEKAREYEDTHVLRNVNEAFTSKTCGQCGKLNHSLGASKVFKCGECEYQCDRDFNGARNILLRFSAEFSLAQCNLENMNL